MPIDDEAPAPPNPPASPSPPAPSAAAAAPAAPSTAPSAAAPASDGGEPKQFMGRGEFRPVAGGGDSASAEALLVAAYLVLWVILFVAVYATWLRGKSLTARVETLEKAVVDAARARREAERHPPEPSGGDAARDSD